jgi:Tfp pilus assembly protein PilO
VKIENRQQMLAIGAIAVVGIFVLDKILISPLTHLWSTRADAIRKLQADVTSGKALLKRERDYRVTWDQMRTNTLPNDPSLAEQNVLQAFDRWSRETGISVTSLSPQWKHDADQYMTLECRVDATGNLPTVARFIHDIEKDPMAFKIESLEITTKDNDGQQLALGLQVSALVLTPQKK